MNRIYKHPFFYDPSNVIDGMTFYSLTKTVNFSMNLIIRINYEFLKKKITTTNAYIELELRKWVKYT